MIGPYDAWYSKHVHIDVKGVQGADDSMVAGIAWAIANGRSLGGELLRVAVACAHASLELPERRCAMPQVWKSGWIMCHCTKSTSGCREGKGSSRVD